MPVRIKIKNKTGKKIKKVTVRRGSSKKGSTKRKRRQRIRRTA